MFKKYLPLIILLLIGIPVALFYFFFRTVDTKDSRKVAFEAVPENAIMVFENHSASDFVHTLSSAQRIRETFGLVNELAPLTKGLNYIDTLLNDDDDLIRKIKNVPFFLSVHQTGDDKFDYFLVIRSVGRVGVPDFDKVMKGLGVEYSKNSERNYVRTKISSYTFGSNGKGVFVSEIKDYILISESEVLVEEGIRQVREGINLQNQDDFKRVSLSAGQNVNGNLFVNLARFPAFAGRAISGRSIISTRKKNLGSWLEMDFTLRPDAMLLNGFASSGDTVAWLDIMKNQEPRKIEIDKVLPANCMGFYALGFSENDKFQEDLNSYLINTNFHRERQSAIESLQRETGQNVVSQFMSFADNEAGMAYLPGSQNGIAPLVVVGTQSRNMAWEVLKDWITRAAEKNGKNLSDYKYTYKMDQERRFDIYQMPLRNIPKTVFGPMFSDVTGKYIGFAGNYLLIADERQTIQDVIYFNELNKTLSTDLTFQSTVELIVSRSNFYFYTAPFRSGSYYAEKLNDFWDGWVPQNEQFLQRMGAISLQIQNHPRNNLFFHNLIIKFADNSPDRPETVWESRLETTLNFKPVLVTNHNTRAREIIVQDEANKLYLVNNSGRILWNLPMEEAIRSEVYQIDYFRNGRLQYLFSTDSRLHLIDREGNYVDKYPINLRSKATNGLALFDYDGSRDYRIFIACEDKHVYLYDKKGSIVKGWDFDKTEGTVRQPVMFKRIGTRDYIIFSDERRIYIMDRRGNVRVNPEKQYALSNNKLIYEGPGSGHGARLVGTDVEGSVYYIYFDGKVDSKAFKTFDSDHYFEFQDLDKDGKRDFIYLIDNRLEVYDAEGKEMFIKKMDAEITHPPAIYRFPGNEKKIGVVTRSREEIYLVNSDGSFYDGFPLRGRTMFSIGYLSGSSREFNLLVGGDNLFLYNYRVK